MSKVWKEVKITVCDTKQTVSIYPNETMNGLVMQITEEDGIEREIRAYMTFEEAEAVAAELLTFAEELKSKQ